MSRLYLTIKCRRFSFLKFIPRAIPMVSYSSLFMRRWTCISTGFFGVRRSTGSPSPSPSAALTSFSPRVYLPLQICQTLQHGSIQLNLLFLGFNQASHGGCNLGQVLLESPSIRIYVIISIIENFLPWNLLLARKNPGHHTHHGFSWLNQLLLYHTVLPGILLLEVSIILQTC